MQKILITIGLPASGKTTWADEFIKNNPDFVNINRDDIRLMLQGRGRYNKFKKWRESVVSEIQTFSALSAIEHGKSVIISDTNLNPSTRGKWRKFAENNNIEFELKFFTDVPLGVCIERDKLREYPVGSQVIMDMFNRYQDIYWPKPVYDPSLDDAYIVDVDGTIAHMHNRRPFEWNKVKDDLPKQDVIDIVNTLYDAGNKIIICSGRDGACKDDTIEWLNDNNVKFNKFFIRPAGDNSKDYNIKREIYETHIKDKYNVKGVFDDRDQVVHLWRHLGLTCMQVNYGSF